MARKPKARRDADKSGKLDRTTQARLKLIATARELHPEWPDGSFDADVPSAGMVREQVYLIWGSPLAVHRAVDANLETWIYRGRADQAASVWFGNDKVVAVLYSTGIPDWAPELPPPAGACCREFRKMMAEHSGER